jgi:putative transposase
MHDYGEQSGAPVATVEAEGLGEGHRTMAGVFRISDQMWGRIEPLIPAHVNKHRFGGGRPRVADREIIDGIFFVLRTGCQWRALDATEICKGSTAHDRFQEWERAGVFAALWEQALGDYEQDVGVDWSWMSIDGSMGKARWEAGRRDRTRPIAGSLERSAA